MYALYLSALVVFLVPSTYQLIFLGHYEPPFAISFSSFDNEMNSFDIAFEWVFNILAGSIAICVGVSVDTLIILIFINILMVSSMITGQLKDLKEDLLDPENTSKDTKYNYRFRAIILMILKYNE